MTLPVRTPTRAYVKNLSRLLGGVVIIWLFVFVLAPWLQSMAWIDSVHAAAAQRGIDATTLFYTETEVFSEAELVVREVTTQSEHPDSTITSE